MTTGECLLLYVLHFLLEKCSRCGRAEGHGALSSRRVLLTLVYVVKKDLRLPLDASEMFDLYDGMLLLECLRVVDAWAAGKPAVILPIQSCMLCIPDCQHLLTDNKPIMIPSFSMQISANTTRISLPLILILQS